MCDRVIVRNVSETLRNFVAHSVSGEKKKGEFLYRTQILRLQALFSSAN